MGQRNLQAPIVWTAFFISGAMVLAAYMGGLALGSWFFGRLADRIKRPLRLYVLLECGVALWGLLFPLLFAAGSAFYLLLANGLGTTGLGGVANKFINSALLLGPSTFLMGGTLPLLTRVLTSSPGQVGRRVAGLYFINSIGAVSGALLAGFALIPAVGVTASLWTAAGLNLLAGGGVFAALRFRLVGEVPVGEETIAAAGVAETSEKTGTEDGAPVGSGGDEAGPGTGPVPEFEGVPESRLALWGRVAVWGAAVCGLVVMVFEVSWIRLLSTILGSSTYSFTLMLAAFITGIAFGSLIARRLARKGTPFYHFGASLLRIGLALLITLPLYARLPHIFLDLQSMLPRTDAGYRLYELVKYLFCLAIMLPPTLASGAALPLATDVAARLRREVGAPVGHLWAVNTFGTIVGALVGGLILLPAFGVRATMTAGIVVTLLVGLYVLSLAPRTQGCVFQRTAGTVALLTVLFLLLAPAWDKVALASGAYHTRGDRRTARTRFQTEQVSQAIEFYTEDINGTVAVMSFRDNYSLIVNGKTDASTYANDQTTQTLIAAIPAMMIPDARRALVIGLGSGQTAGHLLQYPVGGVEIVEISPGVIQASHFFDEINHRPLDDPRTTLVTQDAKTYLLTRPDVRYDLVLSEPSNPWIAGIGGLFSLEYFTTLRDHLELRGVVAQWIHSYQQTEETLTSVMKTFAAVFPYTTVWGLSSGDLLLVGSMRPVAWDFARSLAALERPAVRADLDRIHIPNLFTLLTRQLMSPLRVAEATAGPGRLNTDDRPFLEYHAPRAFFLNQGATLHNRFDERTRSLINTRLTLRSWLAGRDPATAELAGVIRYMQNAGVIEPRLYVSAAAVMQRRDPESEAVEQAIEQSGLAVMQEMVEESARRATTGPGSARTVGDYYSADATAERLSNVLGWAIEQLPEETPYWLYEYGRIAYDRGQYAESEDALREVVQRLGAAADPDRLGQLLADATTEEREEFLAAGDDRVPAHAVLAYLGRTLVARGDWDSARQVFSDSYRLNPDNPVVAFYLEELSAPDPLSRFRHPER